MVDGLNIEKIKDISKDSYSYNNQIPQWSKYHKPPHKLSSALLSLVVGQSQNHFVDSETNKVDSEIVQAIQLENFTLSNIQQQTEAFKLLEVSDKKLKMITQS